LVAGPNQALGAHGEDQAARWYETHGYTVVARNWRGTGGEIDLVAQRDRVLVICEVKTRTSDRFGSPAEAVTIAKQRRIRRLAAELLATTDTPRGEIRFDVVAILGQTIEVIQAAF
jgi:putative endonuclease